MDVLSSYLGQPGVTARNFGEENPVFGVFSPKLTSLQWQVLNSSGAEVAAWNSASNDEKSYKLSAIGTGNLRATDVLFWPITLLPYNSPPFLLIFLLPLFFDDDNFYYYTFALQMTFELKCSLSGSFDCFMLPLWVMLLAAVLHIGCWLDISGMPHGITSLAWRQRPVNDCI